MARKGRVDRAAERNDGERMRDPRPNPQPKLQTVADEAQLLTPKELAERLKISLRTYRRLLATGQIPYRLVGTMKRFAWPEVVAALPTGPTAHPMHGTAPGPIDIVTMLKERAKNWPAGRLAK